MFKAGDRVRVKSFGLEEWWNGSTVQEHHALGYWSGYSDKPVQHCGLVGVIDGLAVRGRGVLLCSVKLEGLTGSKSFLEWELELCKEKE